MTVFYKTEDDTTDQDCGCLTWFRHWVKFQILLVHVEGKTAELLTQTGSDAPGSSGPDQGWHRRHFWLRLRSNTSNTKPQGKWYTTFVWSVPRLANQTFLSQPGVTRKVLLALTEGDKTGTPDTHCWWIARHSWHRSGWQVVQTEGDRVDTPVS